MTSPVDTGPPIVEPGSPLTLPVADAPRPTLRADAQRNRERVLSAAARVIERVGASGLTMEAVADEAGVGKGTVFRRFGDRSSLLHALLDEEERRQQDAIIHGPPPLGPGAPPLDRLIAFGEARLEHLTRHGELLAAAEDPRFGTGEPHPVAIATRMHVSHLLRLGGHSEACASVLSAALLSFLSGAQIHHLRTVEGQSHAALLGAWQTLATGAMGTADDPLDAAAAPA